MRGEETRDYMKGEEKQEMRQDRMKIDKMNSDEVSWDERNWQEMIQD